MNNKEIMEVVERYIQVEGKMPEKKEEWLSSRYCTRCYSSIYPSDTCICKNIEYENEELELKRLGYNQAIDECTLAATKMLAEKDNEIEQLKSTLYPIIEYATSLFQDGEFKDKLKWGDSCVLDGMKWMKKEIERLKERIGL